MFVLRQNGFYSNPIEVNWGVMQGDVESLIIFNLIVDTVLRRAQGETEWGGSEASFYADNGLLEGSGAGELQRDLD